MPEIVFSVETLPDLDRGKAAIAIDQALRRCVSDIQDRPGESKSRKVTVLFELKPVTDKDSGMLDEIQMSVHVQERVPNRHTAPYSMLPTNDNSMLFEPDSPKNARQKTLDLGPPSTRPQNAQTDEDESAED